MMLTKKCPLLARALMLAALLLTACGGNEGGPTVTNMSAADIRYNGTMTVSVSGRLLGEGVTLTADKGCENFAKKTGGDNEAVQFTCRVTAAGDVFVRARNSADDTIASLRVEVPLPQVTLATTAGTIVVELDPTNAPLTVANFVAYVSAKFYDGMIIHRVDDQLFQSGTYLPGPKAKVPNRTPILLESNVGLKNLRGAIAMARLDGQPDSALAEFFVNTRDNPEFDRQNNENPGYAVFGAVVSGLDVVDKIKAAAVRSVTLDGSNVLLLNVPVVDIRITNITQTR